MKRPGKPKNFKEGLCQRYVAAFDEVLARLNTKNATTEQELCKLLNLRRASIYDFRAGKRTPTVEQILTLCDTYKYDLEYMIRGYEKLNVRRPAPGATLEMIYCELQDLKEVQEKQVDALLNAIIKLKDKNNPLSPEDFIKILGQ